MLGSACIVGAAAVRWHTGAWAAILVAFALFMVREPVYAAMNRRNAWPQAIVTLALMCVPGMYLLLHYSVWLVAAAAVFALGSTAWYLSMRMKRRERRVNGEVLGILQLTSATPLVYAFGGGTDARFALLLWLLVFMYYAGSIPYVKMRVNQAKRKPAGVSRSAGLGGANLVYQSAQLAVLTILMASHLIPWWVLAGFLPNIGKSVLHTFLPLRRLNLQLLGFWEMGYAAVATTVVAVWAAQGSL